MARLSRPLPGDPAALYRLRVPASGSLRLGLLTLAGAGRITVSEALGSALSVVAWGGGGGPLLYDLREGCVVGISDLSGVVGVGSIPLPGVVRLLGGRLPAVAGDRVRVTEAGRVRISGVDWEAEVTLAPDPWRVLTVDQVPVGTGWHVELGKHTSSVPGRVVVEHPEEDWAELELIRLEWSRVEELPPLPELPPCRRTQR